MATPLVFSGQSYLPRQIAAIALAAQVDPKTVRRYFQGYAQLAPIAAAIKAAIETQVVSPVPVLR